MNGAASPEFRAEEQRKLIELCTVAGHLPHRAPAVDGTVECQCGIRVWVPQDRGNT